METLCKNSKKICCLFIAFINETLYISHPGDRYVRNGDDLDVVLVFDGNGFIAGIQNVIPLDKTHNDEYYPFSTTPYYQVLLFLSLIHI